jgi:5-methylcytosine-specific restriction endonuclease McrA
VKTQRKKLNDSLRRKIFDHADGLCALCGAVTRFFKSAFDHPFTDQPVAGSVDHIKPVSLGGTNSEDNLRWVCRSCNCARGNRS